MTRQSIAQALRWLATVGFVLSVGAWVQAQDDRTVVQDKTLLTEDRPTSYWLGIECFPVDEALRAQLKLGEETGLVVTRVLPDSPAAQAGIERHDVFIGAATAPASEDAAAQPAVPTVWVPLRHQGDLAKVVREAEGAAVWVKLLRRSDEQVIMVTPLPRDNKGSKSGRLVPRDMTWRRILDAVAKGDPRLDQLAEKHGIDINALKEFAIDENLPAHVEKALNEWGHRLEGVWPDTALGKHGARLTGNFILARPQILLDSPLPDDMTVTVTKTGNQSAKLIIRKGEQTWEITEDKLSELPDEVRGPVEKMLGGWANVSEEARHALLRLRQAAPSPEQLDHLHREHRERMRQLEQQARDEFEKRLARARQLAEEARNHPEAQQLLQQAEEQYEALKQQATTEGGKLEADIRRSIEQRMKQVEAELENLRRSPALQRRVEELNSELERVKQIISELQQKASQAVE